MRGVLGDHDVFQTPVLEFGDADEVAFTREVLAGLGASDCELPGEPAQELHHLGKVVIVLAEIVILVLSWVEQ